MNSRYPHINGGLLRMSYEIRFSYAKIVEVAPHYAELLVALHINGAFNWGWPIVVPIGTKTIIG